MDPPEQHAAITVAYTNSSEVIKPRIYTIPLSAVVRTVKDEIIDSYPEEAGPVPQHSRLVLIYKGQILEDSKIISDVLKVTASSSQEIVTQATFHLVVKPVPGGTSAVPAARIPATPTVQNEPVRGEPENLTPAQQIEQQIVDRAVNHLQQTAAAHVAVDQPAPTPTVVAPTATTPASQQVHRITAPADPLHVLKLSVPCPGGPKSVTIPCYDYMFAPTADGQLMFCMSPSALLAICNTGAQVRVSPHLYRQVAPTAAAPGAAVPSLRRYIENAFTNAVGQLARVRDVLFLAFRLLFMFNILSFQIRDRVQFWMISIPVALVLIYQSEAFNGLLRPVLELIPGFPRANNDNNANGNANPVADAAVQDGNNDAVRNAAQLPPAQEQEQNQNWATARRAAVMFVTSLVPTLHDRWAVERDREDEAAAALIQPAADNNEETANAEVEEQNGEDESSDSGGDANNNDYSALTEYGATSTPEIGEVQKSTDYDDHIPSSDWTSDISPEISVEEPADRATEADDQM